LLGACSLPLGALTITFWRPQDRVIAFRMAFLVGAPHATVAVSAKDTRVWLLPRERMAETLKTSAAFAQSLERELMSGEVTRYLVKRHGIAQPQAEQWVERAVHETRDGRIPEPAVAMDAKESEFVEVAGRIRRLPLFQLLSAEDVWRVAARIFLKRHEPGHTFFDQNEPPDRIRGVAGSRVFLLIGFRRIPGSSY
jgi:CRP-like cAMP-binding protein